MHTTTRQRRLLTLATVLMAAVLAGAVCAGAASAQELPDNPLDNETATPTETSADVVEQLGDLRVHDYSYDGETMTIDVTWGGHAPTTLTITEMIELDEAGATEISFKRVRLLPDERTTIEVAVKERSGGTAAVMLTTPQSIENSRAIVLQAGDGGTADPVPFNATVAAIALAAGGGALGTFWITKRQHEDEEDVWSDRIA